MPAIYRYGTHSESILSDAAARGCVVFHPAPAAAAIAAQPLLRPPQYSSAGHAAAIMQQAAAQGCVVFPVPYAALTGPVGLGVIRAFTIIEQEQWPYLQPPCSVVQGVPLALFPTPPVQNPTIGLTTANPTPFANDWLVPQSSVFTPTAALLPNIVPVFRVQATAIGYYNGIYYGPGDVFDVPAPLFSDSTVDYSDGAAGGPMFGWMKRVPPGTPLTVPTHQVYDWPSARRTVF